LPRTILYEKASLAKVLAALAAAGIATLDLSDRPQSRRASFFKRELQAAIQQAALCASQ
jgi:hypothetical protein